MSVYAERRGLWHEMATALSRLYAMGVASELINDICSLSPKEQNLWVVGSSVFYSLIASPLCSEVVGRYVAVSRHSLLLLNSGHVGGLSTFHSFIHYARTSHQTVVGRTGFD